MTNPKSLLQEYCAKKAWPLPKYDSKAELGPQSTIQWKSSCTIIYETFGEMMERKIFYSSGVNKLEGQQKAAAAAYSFLVDQNQKVKAPPSRPKSSSSSSEEEEEVASSSEEVKPKQHKRVIIIDLENLPNLPLEISDIVSKGKLDMFTVSSKHTHYRIPKIPGNTHIFTSSMAKNASDMCMTLFIGGLLVKGEYDEYFIGSRDKFIVPIVECGSIGADPMVWVPKPMHIITKKEHLEILL